MTWALPQGVRFVFFLGMAIGMSYIRPGFYRGWTFRAYGGVVAPGRAVEALGAIGGGASAGSISARWGCSRPS